MSSPASQADVGAAIGRAFDFALTEAGFTRDGLNWIWEGPSAVVAVTAFLDASGRGTAVSMRVGWRYDSFGDPDPAPRSAHGCVRNLGLNEITGIGVMNRVTDEPSVASFEQQLATVVRKHVVRWVESWKRPDGFRDFLSHRSLHLGAAWASALLGHAERARLELVQAGHHYLRDLDGEFDRGRADLDEAIAAPWAARNGLGAVIESMDEAVSAAFGSERGEDARRKVMEPGIDHRRMQIRHDTYARTCRAFIDAN